MPLFSITGLSGTGKSTINAELKTRGYKSYDGDEDGFAQWFETETGLPVEVDIQDCTPEFLAHHTRDISREIVEDLASRAKGKIVFLCGGHENEDELQDLFDGVFGLVLDEDTREKRLLKRKNSNWGKLPHEREYSLAFKKKWYDNCRKFEYTILDAAQPTKLLVDQILKDVNAMSSSQLINK